jgi:hypothetical protein
MNVCVVRRRKEKPGSWGFAISALAAAPEVSVAAASGSWRMARREEAGLPVSPVSLLQLL